MSKNHKNKPKGRQIAAAVIGNALEWYDFLVFIFLLGTISPLFFPTTDGVSLKDSFLYGALVFGVGFVMRPIGGIVFGFVSDKLGRRKAMIMITSLMAISIMMVTFTPTYATIGIFAPIILVIARLIQGFSSGGEFGSSTALLIEMAPPHQRTFYGSFQMAGQSLALFLGGLAGFLLSHFFTQAQVADWAWRLPFAFGLLIIPVAVYIRRHLHETDEFIEAKKEADQQGNNSAGMNLLQVFTTYAVQTFVSISLVVCLTVSIYITFTYTKTFAVNELKLTEEDGAITQMVISAMMILVIPVIGFLGDKINRNKLLAISLLGYLIVVYPAYSWLLDAPSLSRLIIAQAILVPFVGTLFALFSTITAELFPTKIRSLGLSLTYNIAVTIFGGFATYFVTLITNITKDPLAGAYYIMFGALVGLIGSIVLLFQSKKQLTH